jgi:hypothetical protein
VRYVRTNGQGPGTKSKVANATFDQSEFSNENSTTDTGTTPNGVVSSGHQTKTLFKVLVLAPTLYDIANLA